MKRTAENHDPKVSRPFHDQPAIIAFVPAVNCWAIVDRPLSGLFVQRMATEITSFNLRSLFAESNRGLLLDLFVFVLNLFLMHYLTRAFVDVFRQAEAGDSLAKLTIGLACLAMWLLPPAAATLKRWRFHQRLAAQGKKAPTAESKLAGCLFNPIFYFA